MHDARVQFGCGFLFGIVAASSVALLWLGDAPTLALAALVLVAATAIGALSARYGDRAWPTLVSWTRWLH